VDHGSSNGVVIVPLEKLSREALDGVIDEYIVREGTDYGHRDISLDEKRRTLRRELDAGRARIVFDPVTRTTTLVAAPVAIG
jgi:uncharacterized protein YheU (UPF0270 family)